MKNHKVLLAFLTGLLCTVTCSATVYDWTDAAQLNDWTVTGDYTSSWHIYTDASTAVGNGLVSYDEQLAEGSGGVGGVYTNASYDDTEIVTVTNFTNYWKLDYVRYYLRAETPGSSDAYASNGYFFNSLGLYTVVDGTATRVTDATGSWGRGLNAFKFVLDGDNISVYGIHNPSGSNPDAWGEWSLVASLTDSTFSSGTFGIAITSEGTTDPLSLKQNMYTEIVPEPATMMLLAAGGMGVWLRKRNK